MSTDYKFEGWLGYDAKSAEGNMKWGEFTPKKWTEGDVDIEVSHCGVCATDLHMLKSAWGPVEYPCCVGHEIVGRAVKVGTNVKHVKVGDRVGVGAQSSSCGECETCREGNSNYCLQNVNTYADQYKDGSGTSYGGYATYARHPGRCVVKIPDGLDSAAAAPMLCAGVTVYAPLKHNGCGPGKKVGIVGVGGLGHFAVLFAKALGADEVVGISRKNDKKDDVLKLGADRYIATDDDADWAQHNFRNLDLIINTVGSANMPLGGYLSLLKVQGTMIQLGIADGGRMPELSAFSLVMSGVKLGGSMVGTPEDISEMLQLAADKEVKPWIQERLMSEANQTLVDMEHGKARYRYVLAN